MSDDVKYILPHGWVIQLELDPDSFKTRIVIRHKDGTRSCAGSIDLKDLVKGVEFDLDVAMGVALGNQDAAFNGRRILKKQQD